MQMVFVHKITYCKKNNSIFIFWDIFTKLGSVCLHDMFFQSHLMKPTFWLQWQPWVDLWSGYMPMSLSPNISCWRTWWSWHSACLSCYSWICVSHHTPHKEVEGVAVRRVGKPNVKCSVVKEALWQLGLSLLVGMAVCWVLLPHVQSPCSSPVDLGLHHLTQNTYVTVGDVMSPHFFWGPDRSSEEMWWHYITFIADDTKDHNCHWELCLHYSGHILGWNRKPPVVPGVDLVLHQLLHVLESLFLIALDQNCPFLIWMYTCTNQPDELFIHTFLICNGMHRLTGVIVDDLLDFSNELWQFDGVRLLIMGFPLYCCFEVKSWIFQLLSDLFHHLSANTEEVWIHLCSSGVDSKENPMPLPQIGTFKIVHSQLLCKNGFFLFCYFFEQKKTDNESKKKICITLAVDNCKQIPSTL